MALYDKNSNVTGSGATVPTRNFMETVSEMLPRPDKQYKIESSIENSQTRDFLPNNTNLFTGHIDDNFVEFNFAGSANEMVDLSSIALEVKGSIVKGDGTALAAADNVTLVDGFHHRLIASHSLSLNGTEVESNSSFGLYNNIKVITQMGKSNVDTIGRCMFYKTLDTKIPSEILASYFSTQLPASERDIVSDAKNGTIHSVGPLLLDIADADNFLLPGIDVRLRLDLASPSILINSANETYKYNITLCKLWVKMVKIYPTALLSLNRSLFDKSKSLEYVFERPIVKTIIFPANQTSLTVDCPFNNLIPHKMIAFLINQKNLSGEFNKNSLHIPHCNVSNIKIDINGSSVSNISTSFPHFVTNALYRTLEVIGKNNLLTHKNFSNGRTVYAFDLRSSNSTDTLSLDKHGTMRVSITTSTPLDKNHVLYLIGMTTGVVEITGDGNVYKNYLM